MAELYAPLRSSPPDPELYARFIAVAGEPALELGCGDGDPLIELRRRGIDVEGVDSSHDMLQRCRVRADEMDLTVVVHHQRMQDLELPRRFRCIYLAGATFNLLPTDGDALEALRRIRAHLDPGGSALIPLFVPTPTPADRLGRPVEAAESDGAMIRVSSISESRDETERTQSTVLRYERLVGDEHTSEDRAWTLHWHTQESFRSLAASVGLETVAVLNERGEPARPDDQTFAFWLRPR